MLAFVLIVPAAGHACQMIADCNAVASARAFTRRGAQLGAMMDESKSVVDGDLSDFGAEHFSSLVAYHARPLDVPCDCRVSFRSGSLPIASIFTGCNPGCATERSREARLR